MVGLFFLIPILLFFMSCSGDLDYINPADRLSNGVVADLSSSSSEGSSSSSVGKVSSSSSLYGSFVKSPYPHGDGAITTVSVENASGKLKEKFEKFIGDFYSEGTCGKTIPCANIAIPGTNEGYAYTYTLSQSIGDAMIMMVYFSDNNKSYQSKFDKLWAYYNYWKNGNGLMRSVVYGYEKDGDYDISNSKSASGADLDVAVALVMAGHQFGDNKYIDDAKGLITRIRQYEIMNNLNLLKTNDVDDVVSVGYISPAAFQIFNDLLPSQNWSSILPKNYSHLEESQDKKTKLFSDIHIHEYYYSMNDLRVPWRLAWANAWFGHTQAKDMLSSLAEVVKSNSAADIKCNIIKGEYDLKFTSIDRSYCLSSLMSALTVEPSYRDRLDQYWNHLTSTSAGYNDNYEDFAMQILTGLLVTGNMPNLMEP